jgi:hypothetical protein
MRALLLTLSLTLLLPACRNPAPPEMVVDSGDTGLVVVALTEDCLTEVSVEVEGQSCTLVESTGGEPLVWYGRDVGPDNPLAVRVIYSAAEVGAALVGAAGAWNAVLDGRGVPLAYQVDEGPEALECTLDALEELPQQAAAFCLATAAQWAEKAPATHADSAYVTRLNTPCDGTLRGSYTLLNPEYFSGWGDQAVARVLGHLTAIVAIDDGDALMSEGWSDTATPDDAHEGACAAYQYRDLLVAR